jgi:hypothetical protein
MRSILLTLSLLLAACGTASGVPEGVEWVAVRDLNDRFADADDPTNRPALIRHAPPGMIRQVDVSHDGRPDWLIDYSEAAASEWCGTGGCLRRLYVSGPDGLIRAMDAQVLSLDVEALELRVTLHPVHCQNARDACSELLVWDTDAGRLVPSAGGAAGWDPLGASN